MILVAGIASTAYYTVQVNSLTKLGYTKEEAKAMTNLSSIYNIVTRNKDDLKGSISEHKDDLMSLGYDAEDVTKIEQTCDNLVDKEQTFGQTKNTREKTLTTNVTNLESKASNYKIKYDYKNETNVYKKYVYLTNLLESNYSKLIKQYRSYLLNNGYTKAEVNKLKGKTDETTLNNLKKATEKNKKDQKANSGFASKSIKDQAMRMYRLTNEYRKSKGLKPYKYNYSMQSCVFKEAKAYSINKKPHNWLCEAAANENAGLSSSSSDYVKIAMDFFISDPPHEAVLSGNYNSVAIAIVEKDGMMYMIMDVFH